MTGLVQLGDVVTIQRGTTYKSALLGLEGPVLLGLGTIQRNGGFRGDSLRTYGGASPEQLLVKPGEIYASLKDVTQSADLLGAVARLPEDAPIGRLTQDTVRLDIIDKRVPSTYLYWILRTPQYRDYCRAHLTGTTNLGLPRDDFLAFEFPSPTAELMALVESIEALDAKISSNQRVVALLDKRLMLEFRKTRRSAGTAKCALSELAETTKGVSYRSVDLKPARTSLVTLKSFDRRGGYKRDGLKPYTGDYKPQQVIEPGEVVVAQTDLTRGAEVVGRAVRVPGDETADVLVASLDLVIARPRKVSQEYLLGILTDEDFREHCRSRTNGTTVLHLAADAIPNYEAPVASPEQQLEYTRFASAILKLADSRNQESATLAALRDVLLPELMSGRGPVPGANQALAVIT
ncbi:MAG TPA: restriction endonuclease subunit S [Mycobacterium sp.]|nr:restriction endonuclease subunit S [Mycobacterium sp.]